MSTPHRATPDQWRIINGYGAGSWISSTILELCARIEALESEVESLSAANLSFHSEIEARIEALEATQHAHADVSRLSDAEREQPHAEMAKPAPAGSLVERVADAIYKNNTGDGFREEARAAIREVAAWLRRYAGDDFPDGVALLLEREANR